LNTLSSTWLKIVTGEKRGIVAGFVRAVLIAASVPYSLAMRIRNLFYDRAWFSIHCAEVPVIVVGNLSVGGTGKTPAIEYLARFFRQHGRQVAILSRGYGATEDRNDEARVLEANLDDVPHLQDIDRVGLTRIAVEELERDLLLLDDGFQHRRLHRDFDLVLIDATQAVGPGGRWCLPGGLLREPLSGLRRAHAVILTRTDQVDPQQLNAVRDRLASYIRGKPVAYARHAPVALENNQESRPPHLLRGRRVAVVCGIGNPRGFLATLTSLGATVVDQMIFPDHHPYQRDDVTRIETWARSLPEGTWLLTTQKDWVKLRIDKLGDKPLWSLRIALEITQGREALETALLQVLNLSQGTMPAIDLHSPADPISGGDSSVRKDVYDPAKACSV
jgi:tetraacyldisaccharide 4'-kinase